MILGFVVLAWGFNFVLIKILYHEFPPGATAVVRFAFTLPLLILLCKVTGAKLTLPKGEWLAYSFAGFVASGVYMVLFLAGMASAGSAEGALAMSTVPIWTALFAILKKQDRLSSNLIGGMALAFGGVALVIFNSDHSSGGDLVGDLIVVAAALVWAYSITLYKPLLAKNNPLSVTTLTLPAASLALLPYGAADTFHLNWSNVTWVGWCSMAYLVLVAGIGGFVAYYEGVRQVGPARASMVQYLIPPTAAFFAWVALGQPFTAYHAFGLALTLGGVYLANRKPEQTPNPVLES